MANARLSFIGDLHAVRGDFLQSPLNTDDNQRFAFLGAKRIAHGELLNGYALLDYLGKRFRRAALPACCLAPLRTSELVRGMRAGNYYFAAAVAHVEVPGEDIALQFQQFRKMMDFLRQAQQLDPAASLNAGDLGQ